MPGGAPLLKIDPKGRVWTPAEKREEILREFDSSGASRVEFARLIGVKYPTFAGWIRHHGGCSLLRVPPRRIRCTPRSAFKTPLSPRVDKLSVAVCSSCSGMLGGDERLHFFQLRLDRPRRMIPWHPALRRDQASHLALGPPTSPRLHL